MNLILKSSIHRSERQTSPVIVSIWLVSTVTEALGALGLQSFQHRRRLISLIIAMQTGEEHEV